MNKLILVLFLCVSGCVSNNVGDEKLYKPLFNIGPIGVFERAPSRVLPPIDLAEQKLAAKGTNQLSTGLGILIASLALTLFVHNPFVQNLSGWGIGGGAIWAIIGLSKIFIATILEMLIFGFAGVLIIGLIWYFRKRGIDKWIYNKWKGKKNEISKGQS